MDVIHTSGLSAFGDSFTLGYNATGNNGYAPQLAAYIEGPYANYGVGSSTSTVSAKNGLANLPVGYRRQLSTWMAGLNDIRGTGLLSLPKLENNLRAFICSAFLEKAIPASHMKRTGTWTNLSASVGAKSLAMGANGLYCNNINNSLETWIEGNDIVIGAFMTSGIGAYTYQDFGVEINGVPYTMECLAKTNENISYGAKVIRNCGAGLHHVKIIPTTALNYTVVDYVGVLTPDCRAHAPVLVSEIPYLLNWAQYSSVATQAICDTANVLINDVIAEFVGLDIDIVKVNDFWDPINHSSSDQLHPANLGHTDILNAFKAKITII